MGEKVFFRSQEKYIDLIHNFFCELLFGMKCIFMQSEEALYEKNEIEKKMMKKAKF